MKSQQQIDNEIGIALIKLLALSIKSTGRVDTSGGDKTPVGLALTVKRIISEIQDKGLKA